MNSETKLMKIGVLGSGSGSNMQAILDAVKAGTLDARVVCVIADVPDAGILERGRRHGIPSFYIDPAPYKTKLDGDAEARYIAVLREQGVDTVVLAGFMRIVKRGLLQAFGGRVLNIHPALLPSFPGLKAWEQALTYGVTVTGCTVHFVDEGTDTGPIIVQRAVPVQPGDTAATLHARIQTAEHEAYPEALRLLASGAHLGKTIMTMLKMFVLAAVTADCVSAADVHVTPAGKDADLHVRFTILEQSTGKALIMPPQAGTEGNKYGLEGGRIVKIGGTYHWITTEVTGDPKWVRTKLAYWTSTDRNHWTRVRTLYEGTGDYTGKDDRASVWGPQMVFNEAADRWELFYVIYRGKPSSGNLFLTNYEGKIVRAFSTNAGIEGVGGPFKDIGIIMEPGKDSAPWEGIQGVDAFFPYQVGDKWYAFHNTGAHDKVTPEWAPWRLGLATSESNSLEGPWKRLWIDTPMPLDPKVGQENAIVSKLKSGRYVVVFDAVGKPGDRCLGYAVSEDGVNWSKAGYIWPDLQKNNWISEVCTPLGLIDEDDGVFSLFYTNRSGTPGGWDSLAYLKLKLTEQ